MTDDLGYRTELFRRIYIGAYRRKYHLFLTRHKGKSEDDDNDFLMWNATYFHMRRCGRNKSP